MCLTSARQKSRHKGVHHGEPNDPQIIASAGHCAAFGVDDRPAQHDDFLFVDPLCAEQLEPPRMDNAQPFQLARAGKLPICLGK